MADEMQWDRVIMGIDPGTNVMGYGVIGIKGKRLSMIAAGVVTLKDMRTGNQRQVPFAEVAGAVK